MYDTHCHLTFDSFEGRVGDVLDRAERRGVRGVITVSTTSQGAAAGLALAQRDPRIWCTSGVHPLYADEPAESSRDWATLRAVAEDPRCVAWGELGLDNHYDKPARRLQDELLDEQLRRIEQWTAEGLDLPVVVHCREAFDDLLAVFAKSSLDRQRYVFHCFTGGPDDARRVLDFGAWISFTGVVTFRNAPEVGEAAALVPIDRMMVETDAPFLSPEPVRKIRPNEPANVVHVAEHIAGLKGMTAEAFEQQMDANAEGFFGIG